jgi:Protein of unknown function (DUF3572)
MMKQPKAKALDQEGATEIGMQALAFLAADDNRLAKFLGLTGIAPGDLIAEARTPRMLAAVLEHLSGDESLLLVFAADAGIAPERVGTAITLLEAAN